VPIWVRLGATALGLVAFVLFRRSVLAGVVVATGAIAAGVLIFAS
jgi:hypothetical protein